MDTLRRIQAPTLLQKLARNLIKSILRVLLRVKLEYPILSRHLNAFRVFFNLGSFRVRLECQAKNEGQ